MDLLSLYKERGMPWLKMVVGLCGLLHPYLRSTTLGHGNDVRRVEWPLSRFSCITQFDSDRCPLPDEAIIAAFISKKKHVAVRLQKDLQICLTPIVVDGGSQLSGVQPPPCQ